MTPAAPAREAIRFGLAAIKNVGEGPVKSIVAERDRAGNFENLTAFLTRVDLKVLNKKTLESLIRGGALDRFGERGALNLAAESMGKFARDFHRGTPAKNQTGIFDLLGDAAGAVGADFRLDPDAAPATVHEKFEWERELLGFPISANPLRELRTFFKNRASDIAGITPRDTGQKKRLGGMLSALKKISTKKGDAMGFATIEDATGKIELTFFPKTWEKFAEILRDDGIFLVEGKIEDRRGEKQMLVDKITPVDPVKAARANDREFARGPLRLVFGDAPGAEIFSKIKEILARHPGDSPVEVEIAGDSATAKSTVKKSPELVAELAAVGVVAEG